MVDIPTVSPTDVLALGLAAVTGAAVGAGVTSLAMSSGSKKRKRSKKSKSKKRSRKGKARRSTSYKGRTSTRTNTSRRKVYYTKKRHQPYIILSSGKARFIKKSSAKRMRKLKGGYR